MDGNLLDPEAADETLAKDWNLPELPEGNSSLPSTSQELAEIFGTSDDEEDVDFPFSISSGLPGELSLQNTEAKKFGNSLLGNSDSEMFLTHTFHDTLSSMPAVPVTISRSLKEVDMQQVNVKVGGGGGVVASNDKPKDEASNGKGEELMKTKTTNGNEKTSAEEVKPSTKSESVSGDAKKIEEQQPSAPVLRKSVRLRQRHTTADHEAQESSNKTTGAAKIKQEPAAKEEPQVKMEAGKSPKVDDRVAVKKEVKEEEKKEGEGPDLVKEEERRYVKSEESESGGEEDSDGSSEEEESDEDPDRLWCICRQPHDDRFMICCDQCEEWYHGDCVGISVGQGKRMEREGKEYVCPVCIARMKDAKEEREINRSARQARREETREKELKKKVGQVRRRISSGSGASHAPKPEDDQYGMAQLFLPDNAPKEKKGEPAKAASPTKIKKVHEEAPSLCVGPGCEKSTTPPSVYCSQDCIEKHAAYCLKKLSDRGVLHSSNPSEFVRGSGGVSVLEKGTGMLLVGVAAPSEKNLVPWLMEHPSYQVYLHTKGGKKSKEKANKKPKVEKKEPESPKMPKIPLMDPKSVRANAKKALFQTLWKRREDVSDLSDLDQEAVEKVANDIEEKLHNLYQDINPKYKNKYRSLLFNLKDTRNQGLFRKVLRSEIDTRSLVRMSSEKLASEELAHWRVQTMKRDLEKIKEREEEVGAMGGTIRKMTYKGEVEIEHTEEHLETIDTSQDYALSGKSAKSHSDSTQQQKSHSQSSKSQPPDTSSSKKQPSGSILDLLTDTTSQHHNHVYDHHCAICSGKMKKPPSPPRETVSDSSHPSPDSRTADNELMDITSPAPDPAHGHVADDAPMEEEQIVWRGDFTMHGMAKFSAVAYAVSGPVEHLDEILPPVLEVMGRIAHVQVWDYVDKLRSSTSRDIVVLRFDQVAEDSEAYLAMLDYLVGKHRCGVIKSGYHGIKDMYLLPLLRHNPVAPQLLPFDGPGLPYDHPDMLLGVIVRSKNRKRASISQRLASQSTTAAGFGPPPPPTAVLPSSSETGVKRHNSASDEMYNNGVKVKRTRFQLEVGIGGQTPPILDQEEEEEEKEDVDEKEKTDEDSPYEPGSLDPEVREGEERLMKKIQMSFYGEHRPMESATDSNSSSSSKGAQKEVFSGSSSEATTAGAVAGVAGGGSAEVSLQSSNFQSLLSQLSKEKLEELASVVSSVRGHTSAAGGTGAAAPAIATGVTAANQSPIKAADSTSSSSIVEMVGSTTSSALPLTAEEGGGPQHQLLNANYGGRAIAGQSVSGPPSQAPQWSQDQLQQQQLPEQVQPGPGAQQQHAQYYQGAAATQYSGLAEQQHTVQQHHQQPGAPGVQVYPPSAAPQAQGGSPYDNYPPPPASQSQLAMERQHHHHHHHHQDGRSAGTATGSPYASSPGQPQPQQQQQYGAGGNQQPLHGHHGAPPTHRGHAHQQWEQQHQGEYRQDYGSSGTGGHSNYYDSGGHGYRGDGGNRMPPRGGPHHHHHHHHHHHSGHDGGDGGGWDEGRGRGGHRGHQYHGNKPDRYHDHWHGRGDHDRERHWR